ncbi:MBL fold metallo-hydrolase [Afifella aestuarii]|uniref:MBL fold metallo-hydrolase n=1 Tax=Afifella aestuarii TaxID=1909496 RepID=UPI000FE2BD25|nr:MBL fold metallo-hydrolase [Afifella aestuarii]
MALTFKALSGLGPKQPATFLVEAEGRRIIFDLGEEKATGRRADLSNLGKVDAVVISHGHFDHIGALDSLETLGHPALYASGSVLARIDRPANARELPAQGETEIAGLRAKTGRNGHAIGGVWTFLDVAGGFIYMGDHTDESNVFAFDPPPEAATIVLDASYGDADEPRSAQIGDVLQLTASGRVLIPVPPDGRGIEMALIADEAGRKIAIDENVRTYLRRIAGPDREFAAPGVAERAGRLAERADDAADPGAKADVFLAADADGDFGVSGEIIDRQMRDLSVVFTGHLHKSTRGYKMVQEGNAVFRRYNVHPTLPQNVRLARAVNASTVVPAFADPAHLSAFETAFAPARVDLSGAFAIG